MNENKLLSRLKKGKQDALEETLHHFLPYVNAIVLQVGGSCLTPEDREEIVSDVFYKLWSHAGDIQPGKLRPYLGSIAHNRTKDYLRSRKITLPLEQDAIIVDSPENDILTQVLSQQIRETILSLPEPDREIFLRFYYYYQPISVIGAAMGIKPATVSTRLARGRRKLKQILTERGLSFDITDL